MILQDIAARKALEADLQATKDLLDLGVRSSNVGVFDFDMPDGELENARRTTFNTWELLGYDPASAPSGFDAACALAVHPEYMPRVRDEIRSYLDGERPYFEVECRVVHQTGRLMWWLARGVAFRDAAGKPIRFIGSHVDITDKKRAEEQVRESEHRWRSLAETLPQLVWTAAADGTIDYLSAQALEYAGCPEGELLGKLASATAVEERAARALHQP